MYDAIIIGAGMSGLAAAIRLQMFDKKTVILEKHLIAGGLNSYYKRGKFELDVGLHALTNFARKEEKNKPLGKLLKQLRIKHDELKLKEQSFSKIQFPDLSLKFSNDFELFKNEVEKNFPHEFHNFMKLVNYIQNYNEVSLTINPPMAKEQVKNFIKDELLVEMIFCPVLIYGSAYENDIDFAQFVIMFKSLFLEGFSRPDGGVRTIIDLLLKKYTELGGEIRFKTEVTSIVKEKDLFEVTVGAGEILCCTKVFSSMGYPETQKITKGLEGLKLMVGRLSFTETIFITKEKVKKEICPETIIFYNRTNTYRYQMAKDYIDQDSSVLCFTDNFQNQTDQEYGIVRVTNMANYQLWDELKKKSLSLYKEEKNKVLESAKEQLMRAVPKLSFETLYTDVFTPTTITRYTSHLGGTVYGSTTKTRNGATPIKGLYIIGTDQGFLGIVGSMLSGISMANYHGLMHEESAS